MGRGSKDDDNSEDDEEEAGIVELVLWLFPLLLAIRPVDEEVLVDACRCDACVVWDESTGGGGVVRDDR